MENYKVSGIYHKRLDDVEFKNGGCKGEFVIEKVQESKDGKEWRDFIKFEVVEKWMAMLNNVSEGDRVTVDFSVGGRQYTPQGADVPRYFTTLKAWDVSVTEKADGQVPQDVSQSGYLESDNDGGVDDLPF